MTCSIEMCSRPIRCRGWCGMHYQRWKHGYSMDSPPKALHGESNQSRLYNSWKAMRWRCSPRHPKAHRYHDRGVRVCAGWADFLAFKRWALGNGYADNLTLDRTDNDRGYEPANCQWVTRQVNSGKDGMGEAHPGAKLTEEDVREIRRLTGVERQIDLAAEFGVTQGTISTIARRGAWVHI